VTADTAPPTNVRLWATDCAHRVMKIIGDGPQPVEQIRDSLCREYQGQTLEWALEMLRGTRKITYSGGLVARRYGGDDDT
jgi:hypothetical protein